VVTDLYFTDLKRTVAPAAAEVSGWATSSLDLLASQFMIAGSMEAVQKNGV
jgi:hypothetical protein